MTVPARGDTIVAVATPTGRGGVGVVRLSGRAVPSIAISLCGGELPPRAARVRSFRAADGGHIDTGLALFFAAPHSYTGEDVLELHAHGSPVVLDLLVARCIELNARLAEPGEFTRRAYLNDKLDLAQAEAVADLIESSSAAAARAAVRSLQGDFSREVHAITEDVIHARMYVEAAIDFPEEEVDFLSDGNLGAELDAVLERLASLTRRAEQGALLRNGCKVVIAGKPNAGKSSLMNALAGHETAIVTDIPGTTRDVLRESVDLGGLVVQLADTAGLRGEAETVEAEGIRRALKEMSSADHILYVVDASQADWEQWLPHALNELDVQCAVTVVMNKVDLVSLATVCVPAGALAVSARTGSGLDALRTHLRHAAGQRSNDEEVFLARRRHLDALSRARSSLQQAHTQLLQNRAGELVAEDLRHAQDALSEITGEFTSDDLLGRIFSSFCIGK